jgi:hypothetical protein
MSWFFIALWAPFLLACANHNDRFLLSRYLKEKNVGSILIFSSLFSGVAIPVVLFIQPEAYDVNLVQGGALVATGMSSVLAADCYLYALDIEYWNRVPKIQSLASLDSYGKHHRSAHPRSWLVKG